MRIAFLLAAMLLLGADGGPKPEVTGTIFMVDVNGERGLGFHFDVKDADSVEDNKKLALALSPDAIKVCGSAQGPVHHHPGERTKVRVTDYIQGLRISLEGSPIQTLLTISILGLDIF